jgi:hypothetical protein
MEIKIVQDSISKSELEAMAQELFGDFVKAVVDVEQKIAAFGGELHADVEAKLLEEGSKQENLWGINIYPDRTREERIEFNSMINIRPSQGNRSRNVEDKEIQAEIRKVINKLISG